MISVNNLSKSFDNHPALHQISLNINEGECVGLIGPNGAGKSTLIKIIVGKLKPNQGEVKVVHWDPINDCFQLAQNLGYLPEGSPFYPKASPCEFLQLVTQIRKLSDATAALNHVKELCKLTEFWHLPMVKVPREYRHRIAMAQAIIHKPKILILDEPMAGFDPIQKHEYVALINSLRSHHTILIATHNLEEVPNLCDRFIMLNRGRIALDQSISKASSHYKLLELFRSSLDEGNP